MKIETIFAQTIAHKILSLDNDRIARFCYELKGLDPKGRTVSNSGGWQSNEIYPPIEDLNDLINEIDVSILDYSKHYAYNIQPKIGNIWVNINKNSNHNLLHEHPKSIFAAVYYVSVPENSGHIQFVTPLEKYDEYIREVYINEYNILNSSTYNIYPQEKQLIIFPSWLKHRVHHNQSDKDRISIAMNFEWEI
jgi:uncharacterized protein (TIGR02466 family)